MLQAGRSGIESRCGGFFNLPNRSSRIMALGSTQHVRASEQLLRNFFLLALIDSTWSQVFI
jgi:hypothetical protein